MISKSKLQIQKVEELPEVIDDKVNDDDEEKMSDFYLKKMTAEVDSDIPELNKDFTLSNLSDNMFESRVTNFIRNRIFVVKLMRNVFKYALREIKESEEAPEKIAERIKWETIEFVKTRNLILSEVYTILN